MNAISLETPERLDEDLQIVQATLAAIAQDVRYYSGDAGQALAVAIDHVGAAHQALAQLRVAVH